LLFETRLHFFILVKQPFGVQLHKQLKAILINCLSAKQLTLRVKLLKTYPYNVNIGGEEEEHDTAKTCKTRKNYE